MNFRNSVGPIYPHKISGVFREISGFFGLAGIYCGTVFFMSGLTKNKPPLTRGLIGLAGIN